MKTSNKVWQMTPEGFELVSETVGEADQVMQMKGGTSDTLRNIVSPSSQLHDSSGRPNSDPFSTGGPVNRFLDPLDIFGGQATREAQDAQAALPGQLSNLINTQAGVSRYNTDGPFGSSSWSIDPTTGRASQDVSLNPSQERQFHQANSIAESMLSSAKRRAPGISDSFSYDKAVPDIAAGQYAKTSSLANPLTQGQDAGIAAKLANMGVSGTDAAGDVTRANAGVRAGQEYGARQDATMEAGRLAPQQRLQNINEIAQLIGSQRLNSPTQGGTAVDVSGATRQANQVGIDNLNRQAQQQNATTQGIAQLLSGLGRATQ